MERNVIFNLVTNDEQEKSACNYAKRKILRSMWRLAA